jgi:hypothetical protein
MTFLLLWDSGEELRRLPLLRLTATRFCLGAFHLV